LKKSSSEKVKEIITALPGDPGVYQFYNSVGKLIYVGKAKNLKKRVSSYFNRESYDSAKTAILVRQVADIRYIVVGSELDALLLENSLIKKHQPRYNVMLKDDKTYPWICIKNERFPRVFSTRKFIRDGSVYFGPYPSVRMINTLLELISQLYKLRNCNYVLSEENISKKKFKVCLEYQIGNCLGPCEGLQSQHDYDESIMQIKEILKGNINSVITYLNDMMKRHADEFDFESAQACKEKIGILEKFRSKSVVVNPNIHNVDVFNVIDRGKIAYVNFMKVMNGAIIQSHTLELKKKLDESSPELLSLAITELRGRYHSESPEVLVNIEPESEMPGVQYTIPRIGDKKHLLKLSERNLMHYIRDQELKAERLDPSIRTQRLMDQLKADLRMKEEPRHIECFDNSNIQGTHPVAAMSVFRDGRPSRKDYRHYNIRTVEGPDDYASMEEVIYRRYKRLIEEDSGLPKLIVIDGGKGQLNAALRSLEKLDLKGKITVIGIAKRLEEIYFPSDPVPLYLDKKGESLRVLQQLRDEAHRFGITHHRKKRGKTMSGSELKDIKGIGENTITKLLNHFRSVKKIREAGKEELESAVGRSKASLVYKHFHQGD
jgi:excinuclease ABC subunit C